MMKKWYQVREPKTKKNEDTSGAASAPARDVREVLPQVVHAGKLYNPGEKLELTDAHYKIHFRSLELISLSEETDAAGES